MEAFAPGLEATLRLSRLPKETFLSLGIPGSSGTLCTDPEAPFKSKLDLRDASPVHSIFLSDMHYIFQLCISDIAGQCLLYASKDDRNL